MRRPRAPWRLSHYTKGIYLNEVSGWEILESGIGWSSNNIEGKAGVFFLNLFSLIETNWKAFTIDDIFLVHHFASTMP